MHSSQTQSLASSNPMSQKVPDISREPSTQRELEASVQLAIESFARCFHELCPRIEDELFTAAERETDRIKQSRFLDAYGLVRSNRTQIERSFRSAFETIARDRLTPEAERFSAMARKQVVSRSMEDMSLVDDAKIETDIFIKRLVNKVEQHADHQTLANIKDLDERIGYLLGRDEIDQAFSPFSPDALAHAIQRSFDHLASEHAVRLEVLRIFESLVAQGFNRAYQTVNIYLVERNVLPDIANYRRERLASKKFGTPPLPAQQDDPFATHPGSSLRRDLPAATTPRVSATTPGAGAAMNHAEGFPDTRQTQGPASENAAAATHSQGVRIDTRKAAPAANFGEWINVDRRADSLIDVFGRYRASRPKPYAEKEYGTPDTFWPSNVTSALQHLTALVPASPVIAAVMSGVVTVPLSDLNMLHQVRDNARRMGVPRNDELLIDLAAVLFDKLLQDKQVPERIRRLLARLQVPWLRAVLMDAGIFAQRQHPARRLLDAIARSAIGWNETNDADGSYYQLIFEVIANVEAGFNADGRNADLAVFDDQLLKVEAFMADEAARQLRRYDRAQALLIDIEQREIASAQAEHQLRDALSALAMDDVISGFILGHWRQVMVEAVMANAPSTTRDMLFTALVDLVWSIQPKVGFDERTKLVEILPDLIKRLRAGLVTTGHDHDQSTFFAHLVKLHSAAVKFGTRTLTQEQSFQRFVSKIRKVRLDTYTPPGDATFDIPMSVISRGIAETRLAISLASAPVEPPARVLERPARLTPEYLDRTIGQIQRGRWLELLQGTTSRMMRVRWVSPSRALYLLTDRSGKDALCFTPDMLRTYVAEGLLGLLDPKDMSDRAINAIHDMVSKE
jgi:hypothetical protein